MRLELNPTRASSIGDSHFNNQFANSIGLQHREASKQLDEKFLSRQKRLSCDMFLHNRK